MSSRYIKDIANELFIILFNNPLSIIIKKFPRKKMGKIYRMSKAIKNDLEN